MIEFRIFLAHGNVVGIWFNCQNETALSNDLGKQKRNHALGSAHIKHSRSRSQLSLLQQLDLRKWLPIMVIPASPLRIGQKHLQWFVAKHMTHRASLVKLNPTPNAQDTKLRPEATWHEIPRNGLERQS